MRIFQESVDALRNAVEVSRSLLNHTDVDPPASVLIQTACELLQQERFRGEGQRFAKLEKTLNDLKMELANVGREIYRLELNPEFIIK